MTDNVDIAFVQDSLNRFDVALDPDTGDLLGVEGLETALTLSVFAERRADASVVPQPEQRRGWWGNLVGPKSEEGFEIGSLIWTLEQARNTQEKLNKAEGFMRTGLNWLVEDGIAQTVSVSGSRTTDSMLLKADIISRESATETVLFDLIRKTVSGGRLTILN